MTLQGNQMMTALIVIPLFLFTTAHAQQDSHIGCLNNLRAEVLFVVEASTAIDPFSFEYYIKDYLNDIVKKFTIGENHVRVSVIVYSNRQVVTLESKAVKSLAQLVYAIRGLPYLGGKQAHQWQSDKSLLESIVSAFTPRNGSQVNTTRLTIFITSGRFDVEQANPNINASTNHPSAIILKLLQALRKKSDGVTQTNTTLSFSDKVKEISDHVISIGLKGADVNGVKNLTKESNHVLLMDDFKSYASLTTDLLDPTLALCPITAVSDLCTKMDPSSIITAVKKKRKEIHVVPRFLPPPPYLVNYINALWASYQRLRYQLELDWRLRIRRRIEQLLRRLIATPDQPQIALPAMRSANPDNSVPMMILPQEAVVQQPPQISFLSEPQLGAAWHLLKHVVGTKSDKVPLKLSSSSVVRGASDVQADSLTDILRETVKKLEKKSSDPDELKGPIPVEVPKLNSDMEALRKIVQTIRSVFKEITQDNKTESSNLEEEIADYLLNGLFEPKADRNESSIFDSSLPPPPYSLASAAESVAQLTNAWRDSAVHGGAILLFAISANSGYNLANVYTEPSTSPTPEGTLFKHIDFEKWTLGVYQKVILELWREEQPVVRLAFDAEHADRYSWFRESTLLEAYPWDKDKLKENGVFLRNRNEPFSVIQNPQQSSSLTCDDLRGYLLVVDSESAITACSWLYSTDHDASKLANTTNYPNFIYTLSSDLWNEQSESTDEAQQFSDKYGVYKADQLRIYVVPYSLATTLREPSVVRAYTLLFALDVKANISFSKLWHGTIVSPPGYQPIDMDIDQNDTEEQKVQPCNCWYRSRAIENWHRPAQVQSLVGTVLTGFKYMHVQLSDEEGSIAAELVFDTRGAWADSWFSPTRLRSARPWTIDQLKQYTFFQSGRITYPVAGLPLNWQSVSLWIGKLDGTSSPACESLLLVMDLSSTSSDIPWCISINGENVTGTGTMIAIASTPSRLEKLQTIRQVAIWSK